LRIINVHRLDTANVGDHASSPIKYFPIDAGRTDTFCRDRVGDADVVIVGGGGLLSEYFEPRLSRTLHDARRIIVWGVGNHAYNGKPIEPAWLRRAELVGLRDWGGKYRWTPCASCMSPVFERVPTPKHRFVVFRHHDVANMPSFDAPTMHNYHTTLADAAAFLASGEFVVTNSYHGAYWATLLGRRVVCRNWNPKFDGFKHPPTFLMDQRLSQALDQAVAYPDALEQCRTANQAYYADVKRILDC